jgi:hypothetical protein
METGFGIIRAMTHASDELLGTRSANDFTVLWAAERTSAAPKTQEAAIIGYRRPRGSGSVTHLAQVLGCTSIRFDAFKAFREHSDQTTASPVRADHAYSLAW